MHQMLHIWYYGVETVKRLCNLTCMLITPRVCVCQKVLFGLEKKKSKNSRPGLLDRSVLRTAESREDGGS